MKPEDHIGPDPITECIKSLFPEMEREIDRNRQAKRVQEMEIAGKILTRYAGYRIFILDKLQKNGPTLDIDLGRDLADLCDEGKSLEKFADRVVLVMTVAWAMWVIGELWRKPFSTHPNGAVSSTYGIREG